MKQKINLVWPKFYLYNFLVPVHSYSHILHIWFLYELSIPPSMVPVLREIPVLQCDLNLVIIKDLDFILC